ncbi:hypothetical protein PQ462_13565 [Flavobacterium sp. KACC 22758]|uniref:hypothetical protein n=1 Tax=Flavobacterium sp. KACC 22758 TaxID=3025667 RepID=UPI0023666EF0|nr:hypothetical protein [Flavobacterium sp. KACC 22758]WDF57746.1 hypothetical protein PQ462_13565 [Flavobacterium sp. KACC 22758]
MITLRYFSLILIFHLLISCNEYIDNDYSFQGIYLKEWNSSICPKKIVYEEYEKNTNFQKILDSHSNFEIRDCENEMQKYNQRLFTPDSLYKGKINYDISIQLKSKPTFHHLYVVYDVNNKVSLERLKKYLYAGQSEQGKLLKKFYLIEDNKK